MYISCEHEISTPLSKYQGIQLLDKSVFSFIRNYETTKLSSKWLYHFAFPPAKDECSLLLCVFISSWCCQFLILAILMGV